MSSVLFPNKTTAASNKTFAALSPNDWSKLVASLDQIRQTIDLNTKVKKLGSGYHSLCSSVENNVVEISLATENMIDKIAEIEKNVGRRNSILLNVLTTVCSQVLNSELKQESYSFKLKALSQSLKIWAEAGNITVSYNSSTAANSLKTLVSHLDTVGKAYVGVLLLGQLKDKYPIIVSNLCRVSTENTFYDLRSAVSSD